MATVAAEAFRQSAANMRHPSQPGIVDLTTMEAGAEGLAAVEQLAADLRPLADLPTRALEIFLFCLCAFIDMEGHGGGLLRRWLAVGCAVFASLTGVLTPPDSP